MKKKKTNDILEFETIDMILPKMKLPESCNITIVINKKNQSVSLFIDKRDWEWDFDGVLIGCGMELGD